MPQRCCSSSSHWASLSWDWGREVTSQVEVSLPLAPMRRSTRAIWRAPAKPSSLGSMVRVTMARYSRRPPRLRICSRRGGKVRRQELLGGGEQGGLVVAQNQAVVGPFFIENLMHGLVLGVHPVQLHHLSLEVQARDQSSGGGDFVGFSVDRFDAQESLAGLGNGIDQHELGAAHFLAIEHHRVGGGSRSQPIILPRHGDPFEVVAVHLVQHPVSYT